MENNNVIDMVEFAHSDLKTKFEKYPKLALEMCIELEGELQKYKAAYGTLKENFKYMKCNDERCECIVCSPLKKAEEILK